MFITIKLSRKMLICAVVSILAMVLLLLCALLIPRRASPAMAGDSEEQLCVSTLTAFGWEVDEEPLETETVRLPESLSQGYLALQAEANFDLTAHIGKTATRYTFRVRNYPTGEEGVLADVLIREGKVIGGDIRTANMDGFIHSLCYPS